MDNYDVAYRNLKMHWAYAFVNQKYVNKYKKKKRL